MLESKGLGWLLDCAVRSSSLALKACLQDAEKRQAEEQSHPYACVRQDDCMSPDGVHTMKEYIDSLIQH